jgi:hypothetical protein
MVDFGITLRFNRSCIFPCFLSPGFVKSGVSAMEEFVLSHKLTVALTKRVPELSRKAQIDEEEK